MIFDPIEINSIHYPVVVVETGLRNSYAKLKEGHILIKVPRRLTMHEKERIAGDLYNRIRKRMLKGPIERMLPQRKALEFCSGQCVVVLGDAIKIESAPPRRRGCVHARIEGDSLRIFADGGVSPLLFSRAVRLSLTGYALPRLLKRVESINKEYFGSCIGKLSIRENSSNWGSCTRGLNNISINFRLLFMPAPILEYVIVHELSHTKVRSHSQRFWAQVERALPDYKERRRWLRENGSLRGGIAAPQLDWAGSMAKYQPNSPASPLAASASA